MLKLSSLKIDPEFSAQILPLSFEELQQLEMNMIRDRKLTDPIIVWNKTILDGHNRYNILRKHSFIEYEIKEMEFSSRQEALIWICNHQLGRRNLTPERRKYLIGKRYEAEKQVSQNRGNQYTSVKKDATDQNDPCQNKSGSHITRQRIANETGTSEGYVQRAEKYMNGVEAADEAAPGAREEILNGKIKAADREICAIAKAPKEQRSEIVAELRKPKSERDKQLASSTKSPSVKVESFDDDGSRFLIGISKKMQGYKRALTESDQKALKKSVEAPADHSIHIAAIEGAYDDFIENWELTFREYPDLLTGPDLCGLSDSKAGTNLTNAGLIERTRSGFSKPSRIFLKIPHTAQKCAATLRISGSSDCAEMTNMIVQKCPPNYLNKNQLSFNHSTEQRNVPLYEFREGESL